MKVLIAIDSFKGSMSSIEAGNAAKEGIAKKYPDAEIVVKALADGGEGTYVTLLDAMGGKCIKEKVHDPLGRIIDASYGILADGVTAVIEMAESSGLTLLSTNERNPYLANTYGFGELITKAYERGCREFIIGIGGSATTEAGIGMLGALGYRFYDKNGAELPLTIDSMDKISSIDDALVDYRMLDSKVHLACDVTNPLCGENGAVYVYGLQKGVKPEDFQELDCKLQNFSDISEKFISAKYKKAKQTAFLPGAGAAGGLGFAFSLFFNNVDMRSGADIVIDYLDIEKELKDADIVITGEGRIDAQTASGKGPMKLALLGHKHGCKVYAFAGCIGEGVQLCDRFFDGIIPITPEGMMLETAMQKDTAMKNMLDAVATYNY